MALDDADATFRVVMNQEEQYSIWPSHREIPNGWRETGFMGTRAACLDHIENSWIDMRPASLRQFMAGQDAASKRAS